MKKKSLIGKMMIMILLTASLAGCGNAKKPDNSQNFAGGKPLSGDDSSKEASDDSTEEVREEAEDESAAVEDDASDGSNPGDNIYLKEQYSSEEICIVDQTGDLQGYYKSDDIKKIFKDNNSIYVPEDFYLEHDGILYYTAYEDGNYGNNAIFAIDPVSSEMSKVFDLGDNVYLDCFDYYNGRICMSLLIGEYGTRREYSNYTIIPSDSASSFEISEDHSLDAFCDALSDYDYSYYRSRNNREAFERVLDEVGYFIKGRDDDYFMIRADGSADMVKGIPSVNGHIESYDSHNIIYVEQNDNYKDIAIYNIDCETGDCRALDIDMGGYEFAAFEDGILYYILTDDSEYGMPVRELHAYNMESASDKVLCKGSKKPGTQYLTALDTLIVNSGKVFYKDYEGGSLGWYMADLSNGELDPVRLDISLSQIDTFNYGTVDHISRTEKCPYCGTPLDKAYAEILVLSDDISPKAGEINAAIREHMEKSTAPDPNWDEYLSEDECEGHLEAPVIYCTTNDYNISKVRILDDRYLTVDIDGYWFGGGAHGYPSRDQMIFDLQSGVEVTLADFYKGSEEDFKALVATKVQEDLKSYEADDFEGSPYFSTDTEAIYNDAYESANMENVYIDENGVTAYFYPYELGAYAAGFIDIPVSFEELLGRDCLGE
ncbi:RsiV family protein [Butyrivibrio sp. MC2013]|uniref:RsiV family protein n=1 Tax=Butyrivibrio sp. MC2013 TaxID=1280686 RepID=UPI000406D172|nr:RsiV family protein [Butyrivibrio sp. MC2013]